MARRKYIAVRKCDYCGNETERFVITASLLAFCHEGYVGKTTKDCHEKYLKQKEIEDVRKEKEKQRLQHKRQEHIQKEKEEKIKGYTSLNHQLDDLYDTLQTPKTKRTYL